MTKQQFSEAWKIARNHEIDLSNVDDSILYGCGLNDFAPVHTTLETVAKLLRWQCNYIFGGGFDAQELDNMAHIARKKFLIV
jgi:hypothetical protein